MGGPSPLVGRRVDFKDKIEYYREHRRDEMVKKLQDLSRFSSWRSIRGEAYAGLALFVLLHGHAYFLSSLICLAVMMDWLPPEGGQSVVIANSVV